MAEPSHVGQARSEGAPAPARQRLAGLEGPRGLGCLCVLLVHVAVHFAPNTLAMTRIDFLGQALTFFFALSGFLLYMPYVKSLARQRDMPGTGEYLRHRVLRVFPAYLVIFLIANFAFRAVYVDNQLVASAKGGGAGIGMMTDPAELLANLTLTQSLFRGTLQTGISPSWSLTTEWGFYLVLPVFGYLLFRYARGGSRPYIAALWPPLALLVVGAITNTVVWYLQMTHYSHNVLEGYWGDNWTAVLSRSFLALSDTFAFGMAAAVAYLALSDGAFRSFSTRRTQVILGATMTLGLLASLVLFATYPRFLTTVFAFTSGCFILLIVAPIARNEKSSIARVTDWEPLRWIGERSLSVYLWHYPVLILIERAGLRVPDNVWGLTGASLVVTAATLLLSVLTYRWVEVPALRLR